MCIDTTSPLGSDFPSDFSTALWRHREGLGPRDDILFVADRKFSKPAARGRQEVSPPAPDGRADGHREQGQAGHRDAFEC